MSFFTTCCSKNSVKKIAFSAILVSLVVNFSLAQQICFLSLYDYNFDHSTGTARHLAEGDFDENGTIDVVTSNYLTNNISIMLNDGSGRFSPGNSYAAGTLTNGIASGDFNGDNHLDIAVANRNSNNFSVFLGNGDGTFAAAVNYSTGTGPQDLAIGDFNNDNIPDLVLACQLAGVSAVYVHLGTGTGTFGAGSSQNCGGGGPRWILVEDFDGDNNDDVAIAKQLSGQVGVLLGQGNGNLGAVSNYVVGTNPYNIFAADLNGDSRKDIIAACNGSANIYVLMNDGGSPGNFLASVSYITGAGPHAVVAADFDNDRIKEVAAINNTESTVSVFENNGAGILSLINRFPVLGSSHNFLAGNYNGDANFDILMASTSVGDISFLSGLGNDTFQTMSSYYSGIQSNSLVAGDFNNDGQNDVLVANEGSNTTAFIPGDGAGHLGTFSGFSTGIGSFWVAKGNLNGDANLDAVVSNSGSNDIQILIGNGAGGFSVTSFPVGYLSGQLALGDLDGNGNIDLVVLEPAGNRAWVYIGNGSGSFGAGTSYTTGTSPSALALGFLNTDSNLDLVVANSGSNNFTRFLGTGSGTFGAGANSTMGTAPKGIVIADFDGDTFNDVATTNGSSNTVSIRRGNGTGAFAAATTVSGLSGPQDIVAGDFNADGSTDLAVTNTTSHEVAILRNNGSGTLTLESKFAVGLKPMSIVAIDFNGDNLVDLATADRDQNGVSILINTTAIITPSGPTTFCGSGSVDLISTEAYSYLWSTGANTQNISVSTSNNYSVSTSNFNGSCSSTSNNLAVTVNPLPTVTNLSGSTTICSGSTTTLTVNTDAVSPDINWYDAPSGGTLLQNGASYTTPPLASPATYYVEVTDLSTGCVILSRYQVDVVIGDIVDPVITGIPSNIVQSTASGLCSATVSWSAPNATDNCSLDSFVSSHLPGATFTVGVTTVTYTATDAAGNQATASFTVTVEDTESPIISGLPSTITQTADAGTCAATVTWSSPSANDNCGVSTFVSSHASGSSFPVGTTAVTYTATDVNGNVSTGSFNVVVQDNVNPVISGMPTNISLSVSPGTCGAVASWSAPSATDNCAISTFTSSHSSGSTFPAGVTTVTYTATDVNGNTSNASFTVTVIDTENPVIIGMPSNISLNTSSGQCGATATWSAPSATDNCSATLTSSHASGSFFPKGTTTVTYTATDPSGNSVNSSFTVTVTDTEDPVLIGLPTNITQVAATGTCNANVTWTPPVANDNCSSTTLSSSHNPGDLFPIGTTTVTYTAMDLNGNTVTGSFNVTVLDNQAPVFSNCPANIIACQGDTVNYTIPSATDNCGTPTVSLIFGQAPGTVFPVGTTNVQYRATDAQGNFVNCTFTVTVNASPSASFTLATDLACQGANPVTLTGGSPSGGVYSGPGVTGTNTFTPAAAGPGTHTITYTITNGNGCQGSATDVFTVNANPTVSFTVNDTIACINHAPFGLSGGSPAGGSYSGPGVTGITFTPATAGVGTHTVTYSYTDVNGCSATATDQILVDNCTDIDDKEFADILIYPNPTSGWIRIEELKGEFSTYQILNAFGQVVFEGDIRGKTRLDLDLSSFSNGVYFISLIRDNGVGQIEKFILQH